MWLVLSMLIIYELGPGPENISPQLQEQLIKISDYTMIEILVIINQPYSYYALGDLTIKQKERLLS